MPEPTSPGTTRAPSPISAHTVPWPEADAARYITLIDKKALRADIVARLGNADGAGRSG